MKLLAFIPARLESKRFPNKILKNIFNIPMIEHVRRRVLYSNIFHKVYVVTNSFKVKKIIQRYGGNVLLTKKNILVEVVEFQKYQSRLNMILVSLYLQMNHS